MWDRSRNNGRLLLHLWASLSQELAHGLELWERFFFAVALSSIFTGVVAAGCIMTAITLAGKKGGIGALAVLAIITGREFFVASKEEGVHSED